HTSHCHWNKVNVVANSCQVLPQSLLKIFRYEFRALFGAEHRMQMMLGERMRHGLSPLPGLDCISHASHRLRGGLQHFAPPGAFPTERQNLSLGIAVVNLQSLPPGSESQPHISRADSRPRGPQTEQPPTSHMGCESRRRRPAHALSL